MGEALFLGLMNILDPIYLLALVLGVIVGFLGGATPGISGTMLVIILVPITYGMDTIAAFIIMTTIYVTSVFSASISAILFRTPGTPEALATVFDGYTMAKKGEPGKALGISIFSSAIGGLVGVLFLIFLTPFLASLALRFSSAEYFAIAFLGLTVVASLSNKKVILGLIGVLFGLFIATVGIDPSSGAHRYTFEYEQLYAGIPFVPVLIGLFAISEIFRKAQEDHTLKKAVRESTTRLPDRSIIKKISTTIVRSSFIGTWIGILPGAGATTAAMVSYSEAVRWSKEPEKFGTGIPEGIAAPESGNNAAAMGSFIPLIALGIPGGATTAVLLGAFILHGIQPGPMVLTNQSELVYTIFIALLLSMVLILVLARPFIYLFKSILRVSYSYLGAFIFLFCVVGTFALRNNVFDLWIMLVFGVLGFFLEKIKFPIGPIVIGIVLGSLAESHLRRAVQIGGGEISVLFTRPISGTILALALLAIFFPLIKSLIKRIKGSNKDIGVDNKG
ncbi:tripartite tricarboxylate transporter permease [Halalkalibacter oceani]|uniref:Tripartite tricarboxylate transporter permease n=1 Tax=Halalkalibacter oceani TaxID=1653776 RepID=A0A9X2IPV5_9BACI|nr:tripartite tricarboxylate transporter permease [Halalkalibacter oceani]MCM3713963.1 tripartite tricarboxylate transporter permease [Halalkalibacter oceani]